MNLLLLVFAAGMSAVSPGCTLIPEQQPQRAGETAAQPRAGITSADELLTELEESGKGLEALTATIKYDRTFDIQGDRQIRTGSLQFIGGEPDPQDPARMLGRKFAIVFEKFWIGDEERAQDRAYIFDGEFLYEKIPEDRLMLVKRIVEPGEQFDPLKIGEGPLPIPIGQRKADILARYEVALVDATDGIEAASDDPDARAQTEDMLKAAAGAWQLKLAPRAHLAEEDEFTEIRLWYTRGPNGQILPRMARTVNKSGDVSVVTLLNVRTRMKGEPEERAKISRELFDTTAPAGWTVDRKDLRKAIEGER